jgi:hypothetical protein
MTKWWHLSAAGAVLVVSLTGGRKNADVAAGSAPEVDTAQLSPIKCPEHGKPVLPGFLKTDTMWVERQRALARDAAGFSPGALVPEVNDCQRLIVRDAQAPESVRYGPLGMLFAADSLAKILDDVDSAGLPRRAAAAIYLTDSAYAPLGLRGKWNCLYLVPRRDQVEGRIIHSRSAHECNRPLAAMPQQWTELAVTVTRPPQGALPSVARWTDSFRGREGVQHIWVRCGESACDVHPKGASLPPVTIIPDAVREQLRQAIPDHPARERVLRVHGWYDDQILAIPVDGGVRVGTERAYLVPSPALDAMADVRAFRRWVPVAYAYLPATIPEYRDKLNFFEGVNTISLHRGALPEGVTPERACTELAASEMWYAKVVPEGTTPGVPRPAKYYCAPRFLHGEALHFPGAARWRWLDDDETTWVRCPKGCCAVE